MGGANPQNIVKDTVGALLAPVTGGASLQIGPDTKKATRFTPGGLGLNIPGAKQTIQSTYDNITGKTTRNALKDMQQNQANQQAAANDIQRQLLAAPKQVTPDNFLALKNKQMANLRLGLASTITSTNSLAPGGTGKTKLGS